MPVPYYISIISCYGRLLCAILNIKAYGVISFPLQEVVISEVWGTIYLILGVPGGREWLYKSHKALYNGW